MISKKNKVIISIDPGYERLGLCILEKDFKISKDNIKILHSECFRTSSKLDFEDRLLEIGLYVESLIKKFKPETMAIENLFMNTNQKTALKVSEVKGVLVYLCKKNNLKINQYTPLQIKSAITGSGRSDKTSVQKMLYLLLPDLKNKNKKIDDEYDAIACGLTHFALERSL